MRLSNVLLAAMVTSVYGSLAQEVTTVNAVDSIMEPNIPQQPIEISIDSALLKKIDSLYANRNKPAKIDNKNHIDGRSTVKEIALPRAVKRPWLNCPSCGRG